MTGYPGFDVLLARLSDHRHLDAAALSRAAGVPEADVQAVYDGAAPSPSLLRRLAPALKLHTADLFVIAGVAVPDELTPLDARAGGKAETLVRFAMGRAPEQRQRLLQFVRSLRQESRPQPVPPAPGYQRYEPSYGALLVRMLHNRNLGWVDASKVLFCLGRVGPWSAATVGVMGRGLKELTPELLIGFATVLGIPADDLAALIDIELPDDVPPPKPGAADAAELLWEAGRLTADQVQQAIELAKAMRRT